MAAKLVGISMSVENGKACYIPLQHSHHNDTPTDLLSEPTEDVQLEQIPLEIAIKKLKPLLENPAILKIGQNMKYDALILLKHGIQIAPIDDTMLISYVLDSGINHHGMD